ncbi:MAG: tRNA lysidine(34) synthetase TilS [Bacteroidota bacterium]
MLEAFLSFILEHQLLPSQGTTLLAVSGGVDSVVMTRLFQQAKLPFAVAHCNFGLRGDASVQDESWVRALAQQYAVDFYTQTFDVSAHACSKGISIQMAARELRYAWFQALCEEHGFEKVATAHHNNDNLETVLLHLTKGTGLAGLHGILPGQGRYIRPLLFASKIDLIQYARTEGLAWREDGSNQKDDYQRNLLRHQVVPQLRKINPNLEATFRTTVERLYQTETFFNEQTAILRQQLCDQQGTDYYVHIASIQDKPWAPVVLWEWLKSFGFQFASLKKLLTHPPATGTRIQSATHFLYVNRDQWIITPCTPSASPVLYSLEATTPTLAIPGYELQCTHIPRSQYQLVTDKTVAALDQAQLQFPLVVRRWQPGDAFYPLGMQHRKKLSDFLIDNKVPRLHKAQVWVVTSEEKIVWVVGYRIDDRFKITNHTQQVYELRIKLPPGSTAS